MSERARPENICVVGPTASGKSALALTLARELGGEIVSFDSVQLYQRFDIGAAKPTRAERDEIPHHMIDVITWHDDYDAAAYARDAERVIKDIRARGRLPILVGGTGLYLRAFWGESFHGDLPKDDELRARLEGLSNEDLKARLEAIDPVRAEQIHANDRVRLVRAAEITTLLGGPMTGLAHTEGRRHESFVIKLDPPRKVLHGRIARRTRAMLGEGLVDEVKALLADGCPLEAKPMQSIGYRQTAQHVRGELASVQLVDAIEAATRQYAKRQCTWFRKVPAEVELSGEQEVAAALAATRRAISS